jgi:hypothetical protein
MKHGKFNKSTSLATLFAASILVSACGTTSSDRALSGGLLGAGAGAAIGSVTGSAGNGALIGGLGGAAIGALTSSRDINLGEPIWRHSSSYHRHRYASRTASNGDRCVSRETNTERITTCPKR